MHKLLVIFFLICMPLQAQNMKDVFLKMPAELLLPVDSVGRMDLVDLYNAEKEASIKTGFEDICTLKSFSNEYLLLQYGNMTMEMALLPMINDSKVVFLIKSVCAPACDSQLEFYTTEWKKLDSGSFISPVNSSWFMKTTDGEQPGVALSELSPMLSISLMQFHFDKDKLTLTQDYTTPQYLGKEDRKKLESFLKGESKIYQWKQTRFE